MKRHLLGAVLLFGLAVVLGLPGVFLLNQEHGWIPTQSGVYGIEVNGQPISNAAAIRYSLGACSVLFVVAVLLGAKSIRNWRRNRRTLNE